MAAVNVEIDGVAVIVILMRMFMIVLMSMRTFCSFAMLFVMTMFVALFLVVIFFLWFLWCSNKRLWLLFLMFHFVDSNNDVEIVCDREVIFELLLVFEPFLFVLKIDFGL